MSAKPKYRSVTMKAELIGPCGINCALCSGYQRTKNTCPGCLSEEPCSLCGKCSIKLCSKKTSPEELCIECEDYPCRRLKQLEKRYREKYGETIFDSMQTIKKEGMAVFIEEEQKKWTCTCGSLLCVHKDLCPQCNTKNPHFIGTKKTGTAESIL